MDNCHEIFPLLIRCRPVLVSISSQTWYHRIGLFCQICLVFFFLNHSYSSCYILKRIFFLVNDWMSSSTLVWNFTIASHSQGFSSAHSKEKGNYSLKSMPIISAESKCIIHFCCQHKFSPTSLTHTHTNLHLKFLANFLHGLEISCVEIMFTHRF